MSEPLPELERALARVGADWDEARTERTLAGARRKRGVRRRRLRVAAGAAALGLIAASVGLFALRSPDGAPQADAARVLVLEDGSRAELLDSAARVVVSEVAPTSVVVALAEGRARFDVVPRAERSFRVRCGDVEVQVLGTAFELTRAGARTHVRVLRGHVAVRWPAGIAELHAGDAGWFPRESGAPPSADAARAQQLDGDAQRGASAGPRADGDSVLGDGQAPGGDADAVPALRSARGTSARGRAAASAAGAAHAPSWRQHAEQGDFGRAYALLDESRVAEDVEELLLAADAARLSGHAAQAVPFLQKVVDRHAEDPRASLAAFTLGGVLLNQLGRPREAEAAYARARALSPHASLSQDALARQVEAAHRADDQARARALALEYLKRYPDGRRTQAVRRFGGLP